MKEKYWKNFMKIYTLVISLALTYLVAYSFKNGKGLNYSDEGSIINFTSLMVILVNVPIFYRSMKEIYFPSVRKTKLIGKCPKCKTNIELISEEI